MASKLTEESERIVVVNADGEEENSDPADQENDREVATATEKTPERVIKAEEIGIYSDYGLGLGVDATDPKPWTNKKSFRARHVTFEDVLGTKDSYDREFTGEVTSLRQFHSSLIASVTVPTSELLSLGINVEGARDYSVHKRWIGKKIISRIITFESTFEDICCGHEGIDTDGGGLQDEERKPFEDRLTRFIKENTNGSCSVESLSPEDLVGYCSRFVEDKSITHYVYGIELGAFYYRTISEQEFNTRFGAKTDLGLDKIAEVALKNDVRFGTRKFQSEITRIGRIKEGLGGHSENEKVEEEAVVGVKLKPISSLVVNSANLRKAMEMALSRFINKRQNHEFGPFYISCGEQLLLKVDKGSHHHRLIATDQFEDASQFSIIRCGDEYFRIVYEPPVNTPESGGAAVRSPSLFLCTSKRDVPQSMRDTVSNSDLALRSRSVDHFEQPAKLSEWVSGGEFFYIICPERSTLRHKRRYLCVFKTSADGLEEQEYVTGCKSRKNHNKPDTHMLFSLVKPRKAKPHPAEDEALGIEDPSDLFANNDNISKEKGPFFIVTEYDDGNEKVYFKAEGCTIIATTDKSEASQFCIKHEEGNHFIVSRYEAPSGNHSRLVSQTSGMSEWYVRPFYLTARVNWCGYSCRNHPLQLQLQDTNDRCEQKVQSSGRSEQVELVEPEGWLDGKDPEAFYIKCSMEQDTSGKSSYLCVQRKTTWIRRQIVYSTGCAPSITHHNLRQGRSMLFKLVKVSEDHSVDIQTRAKSGQRVVVDGESATTTREGQETT